MTFKINSYVLPSSFESSKKSDPSNQSEKKVESVSERLFSFFTTRAAELRLNSYDEAIQRLENAKKVQIN